MKQSGRKNLVWIFLSLLVIIATIAFSPVLLVILSSLLAKANECAFIAGEIKPCMIAGIDFSKHMGTVQHWPWLLFYTLPAGVVAFIVWLLALVVTFMSRRKQTPEAQ